MKNEISESSPTTGELEVVVPAYVVDGEVELMKAEMMPKFTVPGFRKGKVPASVVDKHFGAELQKDAIAILTENFLSLLLSEFEVKVYQPPQFVEAAYDEEIDCFRAKLTCAVQSQVENISLDYEQITIPKLNFTDEDIDTIIDRWQKAHPILDLTLGPIVAGDDLEYFGQLFNNYRDVNFLGVDMYLEKYAEQIQKMCIGKYVGDQFSLLVDKIEADETSDLPQDRSEREPQQLRLAIEIEDFTRANYDELSAGALAHLGVSSRHDKNFRRVARTYIEKSMADQIRRALCDKVSLMLLEKNRFLPPISMLEPHIETKLWLKEHRGESLALEMTSQFTSVAYSNCFPAAVLESQVSMIYDKLAEFHDIQISDEEINEYSKTKNQLIPLELKFFPSHDYEDDEEYADLLDEDDRFDDEDDFYDDYDEDHDDFDEIEDDMLLADDKFILADTARLVGYINATIRKQHVHLKMSEKILEQHQCTEVLMDLTEYDAWLSEISTQFNTELNKFAHWLAEPE